LKTHEISVTKAPTNGTTHIGGEKLPKVRCRPRDMDKMINKSVRNLFPDHFSYKIEMVIMKHDQRRSTLFPSFRNNSFSERLVYRFVASFPRVINDTIDIRSKRGTPHSVLEKPKERITQNIVKLMIHSPWRDYISKRDVLIGKR
jgi:hypothetical protein